MEFKVFVSCLVVFILCNKALGSLNSSVQESHEIYEEKANMKPESDEKTSKNAEDILVIDPIKTLFTEYPQNTMSTVKKVHKSTQIPKSDIQSHVSKTEKKAIVDVIPQVKKTVLVPAPSKTVEIKRTKLKKVKKHDPNECELCGYEKDNKIHNPPKCKEEEDFHEELIQTHLDENNVHDVMGVNQLDHPENEKRDVLDHKDDNHLYRQKGGIVFYEETDATTDQKEKQNTGKEKKIPILNVYLNKYGKPIKKTVNKNKPTNNLSKTQNQRSKNASEKVTNKIKDVTNIEMTSILNEDKAITENYMKDADDDTHHSNQIDSELEKVKTENQITSKTETEIVQQTGEIIDNTLDEHVIAIPDNILTRRLLNVSTMVNQNHEEQLNRKKVERESVLNLERHDKEEKSDVVITNDFVKEIVERHKFSDDSPGITYGGSNVCNSTRFPFPTAGRQTDIQYENYLKYLVQLATPYTNYPSFGYQRNAQYMNYPNYSNHASTPIVSPLWYGGQNSPQYGNYPKYNQINTPYATFPQYSRASSPKYGNQASITYPTFSKYEPQSLKFPDVSSNHEYETQIKYDILPNCSDQRVPSVERSNPDFVSVVHPCETDLESEIYPKYENQTDVLNSSVLNDDQELNDHKTTKLSYEEIPAYSEYSSPLEGQHKDPIAVCNPLSNNINYNYLSQREVLPSYPGIKDKLKHAYLTPNSYNNQNINNQNKHKPDYKYTPPPFRYPFQNQLRNINLEGAEKVEYVNKYEPWSNFRNFQSKTTFPEIKVQKYYDWYNNKQDCPNQPRYYNSYDPTSNYIYSEVIVPNKYLDRIWRSWRKTEIHLKNAKNNAPLPIELNQSNVDGKNLNIGTLPVNRRKIASDSNGCYGNLGKPWHSRVDYNPITN